MKQRFRCRNSVAGHMRAIMAVLPVAAFVMILASLPGAAGSQDKTMLIDDFSRTDLVSALGTEWRTWLRSNLYVSKPGGSQTVAADCKPTRSGAEF